MPAPTVPDFSQWHQETVCESPSCLANPFMMLSLCHQAQGSSTADEAALLLGAGRSGEAASPADRVQVTVCIDVTRTFPAQFKSHRGQMLGSGFHDNLSDGSVSRIQDVVKALLQELRGFLHATVHDSVQVLEERETETPALPRSL